MCQARYKGHVPHTHSQTGKAAQKVEHFNFSAGDFGVLDCGNGRNHDLLLWE
jgi:hypothetical protein